MLMKPIILTGKIVHGKELGRTVGMPTANLMVESGEMPASGVYATRIIIEGETFPSITNIGTRPSVDEDKSITVETYILDFSRDIYGKKVSLEIHEFLRPIQQFANLEEVRNQVEKDVKELKKYLDMGGVK